MTNETPSERDRRIRSEEARMVRVEERLDSVHELLLDERSKRSADRITLADHTHDDELRFASIDSRLQGQQTQLTQIAESVLRIERSLITDGGLESRLRNIERVRDNWMVGWKAVTAAAILGASIATIISAIIGLS